MEETVSTPTHTEETVSTPNTYSGNCFNINITEKLSPPALYQRVHRIREVRVPEAFCGLFAVVHRSRDITVRGPRKKKRGSFCGLQQLVHACTDTLKLTHRYTYTCRPRQRTDRQTHTLQFWMSMDRVNDGRSATEGNDVHGLVWLAVKASHVNFEQT